MSATIGHLSCPHGSETLGKEEAEGLQKSTVRKDQSKTVSSGHDRTSTHMNSQQLCLPAQDLNKVKPVNMEKEVTDQLPPQLRNY